MLCTGKRDVSSSWERDRRSLLIAAGAELAFAEADGDEAKTLEVFGPDESGNCQLVIASCDADTVRDGEKEHVAYAIRCVMVSGGGRHRTSWQVRRRYREFYSLHTRLKSLGAVLAELPFKSPFGSMASVVRSREKGLAEYLNLVLERCSDDQCLVLAKFLHVNKHIHGSAAVTPSEPTSSHPSSIASNAPSPFVTRPSPLGQTPHGPSPGSWGAASGPTPPAQAGGEHTAERRRVERAPRGAHGAQGLTPSCSEKVGRIGGGDATTGATAGVGLFFVQAQGGFGACEVDEVIPGSSADEQGSIRVGDVLTAVDSRDIRGLSLAQVRDAIVGQPGSLVTLTLNRPAHGTFSVTLARAVRRPSPRIRAAAPDASAGGLSGPESIVDAFLKAGGNTSAAQRAHARAAAAERTQAAGNWVRRAENVQPVKVSARDQKGLHMAELFPVGGAGATPESGGGGRDEDERRGGDVDLVVALCDFVAARPHELSLRSGDVLLVKRRHTSGWWECEHPTGTRGAGWVPSNHVRPAETGEGNEGGGAGAGQASDLSHEMSRELAGRGVSSGDGPSASKDLGNVFVGSGSAGSRGGAASPPPDNAGGDAPTARMSVDEVCAWLETLELGEYCERFRANKIDGELLLSLEERDLEEDFAMENKYHRRRLLRKLHP